jgi:uncharacterized membrane protein
MLSWGKPVMVGGDFESLPQCPFFSIYSSTLVLFIFVPDFSINQLLRFNYMELSPS